MKKAALLIVSVLILVGCGDDPNGLFEEPLFEQPIPTYIRPGTPCTYNDDGIPPYSQCSYDEPCFQVCTEDLVWSDCECNGSSKEDSGSDSDGDSGSEEPIEEDGGKDPEKPGEDGGSDSGEPIEDDEGSDSGTQDGSPDAGECEEPEECSENDGGPIEGEGCRGGTYSSELCGKYASPHNTHQYEGCILPWSECEYIIGDLWCCGDHGLID